MAGKTEYKNNWQKEKLDRINLTVPKGKKNEIKAHAEAQGESVNAFINRAIDAAMRKNSEAARNEKVSASNKIVPVDIRYIYSPTNKGKRSKATREEIKEIEAQIAVTNDVNREITFTIESLVEELEANDTDFVKSLRRCISHRNETAQSNPELVKHEIDKLIAEIETIKNSI